MLAFAEMKVSAIVEAGRRHMGKRGGGGDERGWKEKEEGEGGRRGRG